MDPLPRHAERRGDIVGREARVDHDDVARTGGVTVLRAVHTPSARVHPLGEVDRDEVVHHRRADARPLRRIHPVAEVEHVEASHQPLRRRRPGTAPQRAQPVRCGHEREPPLHVDAVERRLDRASAARARRRESEKLVLAARGLGDAEQRAPDVVADSRARVRQG